MQRIRPFKTLDLFRGFAAIWVVMVHSCDRWLFDGNLAYINVPIYAFALRGQLGVMIFFVISGYCITAACYSALVSGKSIWTYCYQRVRRIYPPYVVALVMTVASTGLILFANAHRLIPPVHHMAQLPLSAKYWFANLLLVQYEVGSPLVNIVFWSLCYEVSFYCLMGLFLLGAQWIGRKRTLHDGTVFLVSAVGLSTALSLAWAIWIGPPGFPFDLWHYFAIGGLLFFVLELKPENVSGFSLPFRRIVLLNMLVPAALTVLYILKVRVGEDDHGFAQNQVRSTVVLLFCLLLVALRGVDESIANSRLAHPLMWAGAFSYSLYLTHPIILPYIDIVCRRAGLTGNLYWITFWIQITIAIGFGFLFYLVVERRFISNKQVKRLAAEHVASVT